MKIAVTTASGKLGGAIIEALKPVIGNDNIIGVARTPSKAAGLGVEIRQGDYNDEAGLRLAFQGVDAVLIVSGMDTPDKRIIQHRNVINAAKAAGAKKIVYTSIVGDPEATAFSPIIKSNRQTEEDVRNSGLDWAIGRNGLYIDEDLVYIDQYIKDGKIANSANDGRCGYTSRGELGSAYAHMLTESHHNGQTYHLVGPPTTQQELAEAFNEVKGCNLHFENMDVDAYVKERQAALGEFLGTVIGGIYEGIRNGAFNPPSDFEKAAGRPHQSVKEMMLDFYNEQG